jgi:hypothetical protein
MFDGSSIKVVVNGHVIASNNTFIVFQSQYKAAIGRFWIDVITSDEHFFPRENG